MPSLLQPAPYWTCICFRSIKTTSEYPIQDQFLRESAKHEVHNDVLMTGPVQVNLVAPRQSATAQGPSRVGGGGEGHGGVFDAVNKEDGRRESLDGQRISAVVSKEGEEPIHGIRQAKIRAGVTAYRFHGGYLLDPPPGLVIEMVRDVVRPRQADEEVRLPRITPVGDFIRGICGSGDRARRIRRPPPPSIRDPIREREHGHVRPRRMSHDDIADPTTIVNIVVIVRSTSSSFPTSPTSFLLPRVVVVVAGPVARQHTSRASPHTSHAVTTSRTCSSIVDASGYVLYPTTITARSSLRNVGATSRYIHGIPDPQAPP